MSKELTRCPRCKIPLVSHDQVHAVKGSLYCSKKCAVEDIMEDLMLNAKEMAIETYNDEAEIVATVDVLSEDLQEVRVTVTCTKVIKLPKNLSEEAAKLEAIQLYTEGLVAVEPEDCDSYKVDCELVDNSNSQQDTED